MRHLLYMLLQLFRRAPSFLVRIVALPFGCATLTTVAELMIVVSRQACYSKVWRLSRRSCRSLLRLLADDMNLLLWLLSF